MVNKRNASLTFIFLTLFIDVVGLGIIIPVLPKLIMTIMHCDKREAAMWGGWMGFAYSSMQFLFSPLLGALSDRFGRRPVLLFSLMAFGIDYCLLGFANTIVFLFIGRFISGITGASFTTATAYIADISTNETRTKNFGMIGAAFGLGFIVGPLIGGLLGHYGLRVPFFAAAGLSLANTLYGYFVLPESLKPEHRRKFEWKRANPVGALKHLQRYPAIIGLAISIMLLNLAGQSLQTTWSYYGSYRFNWDERMIGYSLAIVGLSVAIVQGGLTRKIVPWLGEKRSIYTGLILYAIGMVVCGLSTQTWMIFLGIIPLALGGLAGPTMQSIMSGQVPPTEQGELQGTITSLVSIDAIISPLLYPFLFEYFSGQNMLALETTKHGANARFDLSGAAFLCAALLTIIALIVVVRPVNRYLQQKKLAAAAAAKTEVV